MPTKTTIQAFKEAKLKNLKKSSKKVEKENNKASDTKKAWKRILEKPESKRVLKEIWSSKNPSKEYGSKIKQLLKKH